MFFGRIVEKQLEKETMMQSNTEIKGTGWGPHWTFEWWPLKN